MTEFPIHSVRSPLVIGATGGSGTRVMARIVRRAGYDLGTYLNEAEDALAFAPFHDRWINRLLAADARPLTTHEDRQLVDEFRSALKRHAPAGPQRELWGWKAPRSIYFLPLLQRLFPQMKFIHAVRDGRDMAFSENQNQLRKHGAAVLGWRERWLAPKPLRSILLWDRVNRRAAAYGEDTMGDSYLAVRFEDLCCAPVETVERILCFLGSNLGAREIARGEIAPPATLARWRSHPAHITRRLTEAAAVSLEKFGYLAPSAPSQR
ncbi:sulfotransferase [soil metagenome]